MASIPTKTFHRVLNTLLADGWLKTYEYQGFDAGIDYGEVKLPKDGSQLPLVWDNWIEGKIDGDKDALRQLQINYGF